MKPPLVLVALLAVGGVAAAQDAPPPPPAAPPAAPAAAAPAAAPKPLTSEQAADAVLAAVKAKDDAALKALAAKDDPDPWLVADELIRRGAHDVAEAFAKAAPRKDVESLPAYVESRRGQPDDARLRDALGKANSVLVAKQPDRALEYLASAPGSSPELVLGVRIEMCRGSALRSLARLAAAAAAYRAAAESAERIGWLARASSAWNQSGEAAYRGSRFADARDAWERRLAVCERRGDRSDVARALCNIGVAWDDLGEYERALDFYARALSAQEELGDRAGAAITLGNMGNVHEAKGNFALALAFHERAFAAKNAAGNRAGAALTLANIANIHQATGNNAKAVTTYEQAIALQESLGDHLSAAQTRNNLGAAYRATGEYEKALANYERALIVTRTLGARASVARALSNIASLRVAQGDLEAAAAQFEAALAELETLGDRSGAAIVYIGLGNVYLGRGEMGKALAAYERARSTLEALGRKADADGALLSIGRVYIALGDHRRARTYFEQALTAADARGDRQGAARALGNLGVVHRAMGDSALALSAYDRALVAMQACGDSEGIAATLGNIAAVYQTFGDHVRSLSMFERARAAMEAIGDRRGAARVLGNIGAVYESMGDSTQALRMYERALELKEALGDRVGVADTLSNVGVLHSNAGDYPKALSALEKALTTQEALGDRAGAQLTLGMIGDVYYWMGDHARARSIYEPALLGAETLGTKSEVARLLGALCSVHRALGDLRKSLDFGRRAVDAISQSARGLATEEGSIARQSLAFVFDTAARTAVASTSAPDLAFFLESERAGALVEGLHARDALWAVAVPEELRMEEARARAAEAAATRAARKAEDLGEIETARKRRAELDAARGRVGDIVARIQREAKGGAAIVAPEVAGLDLIRAALSDGEVLVLYALFESAAVALVVTKDGARIVPLGSRDRIDAAIEGLRLDDPTSDSHEALARLATLTVEPLELPVTTRRVLVSPSGPLTYVPFGALILDRTVTCVPSGTTYRLLRDEEALRGEGVLAVGDPAYEVRVDDRTAGAARGGLRRLGRLPATRLEAQSVGTVTLLDAEATEAGFAAAVAKRPRWRSVHLACHGLVDTVRPAMSSLALTPSGDDDGFLSCLDVFRLRIPTELAVLSACETGRGKIVRGEGLVGLMRAFMYAGSPRVICSLWKVDDDATRALMVKFYELWNPKDGKPGLPTAEALRKAQEFVRDDPAHPKWKHPYYWAAWVLWGLPS